jgi:hypothetical protein
MNTTQQFQDLLSNPQVDPNILSIAMYGLLSSDNPLMDENLFKIVLKNPQLPFNLWRKGLRVDTATAFQNPMIDLLLLEDTNLFGDLSMDEYECLLDFDFLKFYKVVAHNPLTIDLLFHREECTTEFIEKQLYPEIKYSSDLCFCLIASRKALPMFILEELSEYEDIDIKKAILDNKLCTDQMFKKFKKDQSVRDFAVSCDPDSTAKDLLSIIKDQFDLDVLNNIIRHPNTTVKILKELKNTQTNPDIVRKVEDKLNVEGFGTLSQALRFKQQQKKNKKK